MIGSLGRTLTINSRLVTTSMAQFSDDGEVLEHRAQAPMIDLYDQAIQLWQSHAPYTRAGKFPPDGVIDMYVKFVKARKRS